MKRVLLGTIILTATSVLAAESYDSASWSKAYALRQIKLGMTLEDFRLVKLGDTKGSSNRTDDFIVCDRDELATVGLAFRGVQEFGIRDVGVTKCAFYYGTGFTSESFFPTNMGFGERYAGEYKAEYETGFYFIRPQGAPHAYLFRIKGDLNPDFYYKVREGISKKYGAPKLNRAMVQNGFGALFRNETATWSNSVSRIKLEKYDFNLQNGKVVYELTPLQSIYEKRKAAVSKPEPTESY